MINLPKLLELQKGHNYFGHPVEKSPFICRSSYHPTVLYCTVHRVSLTSSQHPFASFFSVDQPCQPNESKLHPICLTFFPLKRTHLFPPPFISFAVEERKKRRKKGYCFFSVASNACSRYQEWLILFLFFLFLFFLFLFLFLFLLLLLFFFFIFSFFSFLLYFKFSSFNSQLV